MKTIQELNAKWYWRLVKVFYFLIFPIVIFACIAGIFYYFHTYDPKYFKQILSDINTKEQNLEGKVLSLKAVFPNKSYQKAEFKKILNTKNGTGFLDFQKKETLYLTLHLLIGMGKNIEDIEECDYSSCGTDEDMISGMLFSLEDSGKIFLYSEDIKEINDQLKTLLSAYTSMRQETTTCLSKLDEYCYISDETKFEELTGINMYFGYSGEYLGFKGWVKVILSAIGIIIFGIIFTLIIRGTIYYIILGKFNPEK